MASSLSTNVAKLKRQYPSAHAALSVPPVQSVTLAKKRVHIGKDSKQKDNRDHVDIIIAMATVDFDWIWWTKRNPGIPAFLLDPTVYPSLEQWATKKRA